MCSLSNENTRRGGQTSNTGFASDVSPRTCKSAKGVSPRSVRRQSADPPDKPDQEAVWFLMRAAYGQERKAKDILEAENIEVFLPVTNKMRIIGGKRKLITESLIPNFLFVHTTERMIRKYVGSPGLSFLHHYYIPNKDENGCPIGKSGIKPLIVPDDQMESFLKWYETEDENKMFISDTESDISKGDKVKIISGKVHRIQRLCLPRKKANPRGGNHQWLRHDSDGIRPEGIFTKSHRTVKKQIISTANIF